MTRKTSHPRLLSTGMEIAFHQAGQRPAAQYVSAAAVCEEALEHGRWIGLYWSASGQVQYAAVVGEGVPARSAADASGTAHVRHGYDPEPK